MVAGRGVEPRDCRLMRPASLPCSIPAARSEHASGTRGRQQNNSAKNLCIRNSTQTDAARGGGSRSQAHDGGAAVGCVEREDEGGITTASVGGTREGRLKRPATYESGLPPWHTRPNRRPLDRPVPAARLPTSCWRTSSGWTLLRAAPRYAHHDATRCGPCWTSPGRRPRRPAPARPRGRRAGAAPRRGRVVLPPGVKVAVDAIRARAGFGAGRSISRTAGSSSPRWW